MRPQKVQDKELINHLLMVFRSKGYEGASLADLAKSSGLQKASLYHRFPKGKKEIAFTVLSYVNKSIENLVYKILTNTAISLPERLDIVLGNINTFYEGGEATCLFRSLSLDSDISLFHSEIKKGVQKWIDGFTAVGEELGLTKVEATKKANAIFIHLQGSLILGKSMGSTSYFKEVLTNIRKEYRVVKN